MTVIKNITISLLAIILGSVGLLYATGNGFIITSLKRTYMIGEVTANINDFTEFKTNVITSSTAQAIPKHASYNQKELSSEFKQQLEELNAAAFLVLKDGQVVFEEYLSGYNDRSKTNSFSMAKTVTTMLLGIAIEEGYVRDLDQAIVDFLPEFKDDPIGKTATIRQLSLMNSGYEWDENYYTPFSPTVRLYYGGDVSAFTLGREFSAEPGSFWEYSSASTELLGIFLLRALQKAGAAMTLSEYLSEKIWQPMGMNDDALWHTDDQGMELTYCCLSTNARNYAKLGLLMMNNGNWNGQQLIPQAFVEQMVKPEGNAYYGLSTWLSDTQSPAFYAFSGHLGQFIINVPEHNMVVVRLGEKAHPSTDFMNETLPMLISEA
ncbi:MAG: CubicO group peptidase (beta-lactamase class C family), partial [Arenicella sp.]